MLNVDITKESFAVFTAVSPLIENETKNNNELATECCIYTKCLLITVRQC